MNPYSYHMITFPKGNAVDLDMPEIAMEDSDLSQAKMKHGGYSWHDSVFLLTLL